MEGPQETKYFATQQEQDAVIGRITREHAEAARRLTVLLEEANKVGKLIDRFSRSLQLPTASQLLLHMETALALTESERVDWSLLSKEKISRLVSDIKLTTAEYNRLEQQKRSLGI